MNFTIVDIEPNSPEHFEFRKGKIGGSMAPTIMGCGFKTPLELWEEIVFDKKRPVTGAMRRGTELEPKARDYFNLRMEMEFKPLIIQSIEHPWRIASLDGFCEKDGKVYLLEIKCPGSKDHALALSGTIPDHYYPQLQHTMDVAGVDEMYYLSFDGTAGISHVVKKDDDYCKKLLKAEKEFYRRIIDHDPPASEVDDWIRIDDEEKVAKAERRRELEMLFDEIKAEIDELDRELTQDLPHSRCIIGCVKATQITRQGNIDYKKIEALQGIDLEPYRKKPISFWKITV